MAAMDLDEAIEYYSQAGDADSGQVAGWLKELRGRTCWIPVAERLPENSCEVLVRLEGGTVLIARYGQFDIDGWSSDSNKIKLSPVVAWMPLPED